MDRDTRVVLVDEGRQAIRDGEIEKAKAIGLLAIAAALVDLGFEAEAMTDRLPEAEGRTRD